MIIEEVRKRRSIRAYQKREVSEADLREIIKAAQFAPTAKNTRSWEFYVVRNAEKKNRIAQILGQEFLSEAPLLIVLAADTAKTPLPIQDLSAASENILLQATKLGLGTVWKNVPPDFQAEIKMILGIPDDYLVMNLIPVGYPAEEKEPHSEANFDPAKIHLSEK